MSRANRIRRGGLLSAVAGAVFVPYAFSKGYLAGVIVATGWHLSGLTPVATAQLFHVLEAVPLAVMGFGLVSLDARTPARGGLADAGLAVALVGFGLTILTHLGEHLLAPLTVPGLTGGENWFMWGYYLSWLVVYGGFALYGLALSRTGDAPGWLSGLFVGLLPAAAVVGLVATTLGLFTVAGTLRVAQGLTWVVVGRWLWIRSDEPIPARSGPVAGPGTDDR